MNTPNCNGPFTPAPGYTDPYGPLACEVHGTDCFAVEVRDSWQEHGPREVVRLRQERDEARAEVADARCYGASDYAAHVASLLGEAGIAKAAGCHTVIEDADERLLRVVAERDEARAERDRYKEAALHADIALRGALIFEGHQWGEPSHLAHAVSCAVSAIGERDDARAEVARLTRERDEARAAIADLGQVLDLNAYLEGDDNDYDGDALRVRRAWQRVVQRVAELEAPGECSSILKLRARVERAEADLFDARAEVEEYLAEWERKAARW